MCGVDLGYAAGERPVLVGGRGLRRCAPACEVVEVPLDQGVAVVVRVVGGRLHVGYDPARVDAEQVAAVLRAYG